MEVIVGGVHEERVGRVQEIVISDCAGAVVLDIAIGVLINDVVLDGGVAGAAIIADADADVDAAQDVVIEDAAVRGTVIDRDAGLVVPDQVIVNEVAVADVDADADAAAADAGVIVKHAVADNIVTAINAVHACLHENLHAPAGVAVDVAAVDEVVIRLDVQAVVKIGRAVVVNLVLDELVIVGRGVARETLHEHSLGAGIFDIAIADADMGGSAAGQGHDIDIGAGRAGAVKDEAIDGDVTHRALD